MKIMVEIEDDYQGDKKGGEALNISFGDEDDYQNYVDYRDYEIEEY